MTDSPTHRDAAGRQPIAASPVFWLLLFGVAALAAGLAIQPKHGPRQARIERMQQARQEAAMRRTAGDLSAPPVNADPPQFETEPSLRPLLVFLGAVTFVAAVVVAWFERRSCRQGAQTTFKHSQEARP